MFPCGSFRYFPSTCNGGISPYCARNGKAASKPTAHKDKIFHKLFIVLLFFRPDSLGDSFACAITLQKYVK